MPYAEIEPGLRLYYEDRGRGKTLLFVHGWGMNGMVWEGQVVPLSRRYRVITVDCRGCGRSDKPAEGYRIENLSSDLRQFIRALDLTDVTLIGWSAGGTVVTDYVIRYGEGVSKAIVVGGAVPRYTAAPDFPLGAPPDTLQQTLAALGNPTSRCTVLRAICDGCFHADLGTPAKDWFFNIFTQHSWFVDETLADLGQIDLREQMRSIRIPIAFFHGRHDQIVPFGLGEWSAQAVPGAKLVAFSNSAHAPFVEEPERFNEELQLFVG